jgi:hypothetical protein
MNPDPPIGTTYASQYDYLFFSDIMLLLTYVTRKLIRDQENNKL